MLAKNLKLLRNFYGDKQIVLAKIFNVPQSNISAYENGKKEIPQDILKKIAMRYGESESDLMNIDLSEMYMPQIANIEALIKFSKNLFPILISKSDKANETFKMNINKFYKVFEDETDDTIEGIKVLDELIDSYMELWKQTKSYCALINSTSIILYEYLYTIIMNLTYMSKNLNFEEIDTIDLQEIKKIQMNNNNYVKKDNRTEQSIKIYEKYEKLIYKNIKKIKQNMDYADIADYYLAIMYCIGFTDIDEDYETCVNIGIYMLYQLSNIDNKYAIDYLEKLATFL